MLRREGSLPPFEATDTMSSSLFDGRLTRRFYQALSAQWLASEALCLWRVLVSETSLERGHTLIRIRDMCVNHSQRDVSQALDNLEIFDSV